MTIYTNRFHLSKVWKVKLSILHAWYFSGEKLKVSFGSFALVPTFQFSFFWSRPHPTSSLATPVLLTILLRFCSQHVQSFVTNKLNVQDYYLLAAAASLKSEFVCFHFWLTDMLSISGSHWCLQSVAHSLTYSLTRCISFLARLLSQCVSHHGGGRLNVCQILLWAAAKFNRASTKPVINTATAVAALIRSSNHSKSKQMLATVNDIIFRRNLCPDQWDE